MYDLDGALSSFPSLPWAFVLYMPRDPVCQPFTVRLALKPLIASAVLSPSVNQNAI